MLSATEIARLAEEAAESLVGSRIQKVGGSGPERFALEVFGDSGKACLLIALEAELPRLHLTTAAHPGPKKPYPLVEILRKQLSGGRVRECCALPDERVVRIRIEIRHDERLEERLLLVELFPKSRNLILTDGELKILGLLRRGGGARPQIKHGGTWSAPAAGGRKNASEAQPFAFLEDPGTADLSAALEAWATPRETASNEQRVGARLLSELRRRAKKERRLLTNLQRELDGASRADELRLWAELIKHNLQAIPKGAAEATLTDWSSGEGVDVTISLEPTEPALETMNRYFKQAKKHDKALPRVAARLGNAEDRIADIETMIGAVEDAADLDTIVAIREEAIGNGWAKPEPIPKGMPLPARRKPVQERRKHYRRFVSKDGIEMLVGRTAQDNDELSLRTARGNEHWMHVANYAGSHVVIRFSTDDLPPETLLDAASLAVNFSQAKGGRVEVHRTRCKYVSKFRGAKPGQVQLAKYRSLRVQPDPERLDRLLNAPKPPEA
ncbi:MAG: NFACT family protein [Planctomycetota bacterium]|nr:NFACT family protein [Planctomycetota bacterium]